LKNFADGFAAGSENIDQGPRLDCDVLDDELHPIPEFLDAVSAIALRVLDPDGEAGFMDFFFG